MCVLSVCVCVPGLLPLKGKGLLLVKLILSQQPCFMTLVKLNES